MGVAAPAPLPAAITETHISILFFVGDRAFKLKKPVSFGFLDFSTREAREHFCHREVELNRRLAPDVYLGVADVNGPDGAPCDHLVMMRRMPGDRCLSNLLIERPGAALDSLREVARLMATFHERAERSAAISLMASRDAVAKRWRDNFREMAAITRGGAAILDARALHRAEVLADRFLTGRGLLFDRRAAGGFACDGHGDLQAGDIYCLDDGPRILDCIEFDDALRWSDVADDVAFLMMDLERLGHGEASMAFLHWYEEFSGHAISRVLLHQYVAYRAQVRAKVAALRAAQEQPGTPAASDSASEAAALLHLCTSHLEAAQVRLCLVGGLPGTGKSTQARGLADHIGATLLRSDEVRKELAGLDTRSRAPAAFGEGIYTPDRTDAVYDDLCRRARVLLSSGESVVIDASWNRDRHRDGARRVASATASDLVEIRCTVDRETADRRIRKRLARGSDASDADPEIAAAMALSADPWPGATDLDTHGTKDESLSLAISIASARLAVAQGIDGDTPPGAPG